VIEAAGGVIWRVDVHGSTEVLLVHRPRYDDWSLPKGKRDRGETALECALREVWEETGLRCVPGPELCTARYVDRKGREKRVRYWSMRAASGSFTPNDEVDEVRWVADMGLADQLSYAHDLVVVESLRLLVAGRAGHPTRHPVPRAIRPGQP
jgi:8-oxo-dGTP diphosphatase